MNKKILELLNTNWPQNYIIRKPFKGAIIIALFYFGFSALYRPFEFHSSRVFGYTGTMAIYSLVTWISVGLYAQILKKIKWFADIKNWTIFKELLSIIFVLFGIGIVIYIMGFIVEPPAQRLNFPTFLDSFEKAFLLGIIPFGFFTASNYRYLFSKRVESGDEKNSLTASETQPPEELLQISSKLKKEELSFYPGQFIYAESDGNYVVFYLDKNSLIKKQIIRNSISNIEQQLSAVPYFLRTHRSFIVNLKKVISKQGNILGYQLKISGTEFKIPVSRNKIDQFDKLFRRYKNN
jgi:hypothetical protein